jgi:hypothetical protein
MRPLSVVPSAASVSVARRSPMGVSIVNVQVPAADM